MQGSHLRFLRLSKLILQEQVNEVKKASFTAEATALASKQAHTSRASKRSEKGKLYCRSNCSHLL
jgi:hypothetical protein